MYLSSMEMSQLSTEDDSFDCRGNKRCKKMYKKGKKDEGYADTRLSCYCKATEGCWTHNSCKSSVIQTVVFSLGKWFHPRNIQELLVKSSYFSLLKIRNSTPTCVFFIFNLVFHSVQFIYSHNWFSPAWVSHLLHHLFFPVPLKCFHSSDQPHQQATPSLTLPTALALWCSAAQFHFAPD